MSNIALNPSVKLVGGQATTTSLKIAEAFGKRHCDVLRAINNLECSPEFAERNFALSKYEVNGGKNSSRVADCYTITRDGFAFLASGFTGKEAAQWKERYIAAFNALEKAALDKISAKALAKPAAQPSSPVVIPALTEFSDELNRAISHKTQSLMMEGYDRTRESVSLRVRSWKESGWSNERILTELAKLGGTIGDLHLIQAKDLYGVTSMLSVLQIITASAMEAIHNLESQTGQEWYGRAV